MVIYIVILIFFVFLMIIWYLLMNRGNYYYIRLEIGGFGMIEPSSTLILTVVQPFRYGDTPHVGCPGTSCPVNPTVPIF